MATQRIAFTEWLPDQPGVTGALTDANNVIPVLAGYAPFNTVSNYSKTASEDLNNVIAAKFSGITQIFAGGDSKLFKFNSSTLALEDVSDTGGYSGSSRWQFVQFGNTLLATNDAEKIQAWTVGSSTAFAEVSASAPVAKYITVIRDFVVVGNLNGGSDANKVQWSDINDETDWTSGAASQSDYQIIADGGNIQGLTGGEFGLVLLEKSIVRMSYIGSPLFFQFDTISRGLGCLVGGSIAQYGPTTYFLSDDGFYSCDGQNVIGIGNEKVDNYFFDNFDMSRMDTISAAADPARKIVLWDYPNVDGGRSILIYNVQLKKWSRAETTVNYISPIASSGVTLEEIEGAYAISAGSFVVGKQYTITTVGTTDFTLIGAVENAKGVLFTATGVGSGTGVATDMAAATTGTRTLDTLGASLDDRLWTGGTYMFAGVTNGYIVTFTGTPATANINTGDIELGYNSVVTLARPQVDNGSASVSVASRRELDDTITYSTQVVATSEGRCSLRSAGRYHRISLIPSGSNWKHAVSVDIDIESQGSR